MTEIIENIGPTIEKEVFVKTNNIEIEKNDNTEKN